MKEHEKLCRKMVLEIVCIFVCVQLSLWIDVYAKCGPPKICPSYILRLKSDVPHVDEYFNAISAL